jgi:hypothetical protein
MRETEWMFVFVFYVLSCPVLPCPALPVCCLERGDDALRYCEPSGIEGERPTLSEEKKAET